MKSIEEVRKNYFYIPVYVENGLNHYCWTEEGKLKESIILSEAIPKIFLNGSFMPLFDAEKSSEEFMAMVDKVEKKFESFNKGIDFVIVERKQTEEYSLVNDIEV